MIEKLLYISLGMFIWAIGSEIYYRIRYKLDARKYEKFVSIQKDVYEQMVADQNSFCPGREFRELIDNDAIFPLNTRVSGDDIKPDIWPGPPGYGIAEFNLDSFVHLKPETVILAEEPSSLEYIWGINHPAGMYYDHFGGDREKGEEGDTND